MNDYDQVSVEEMAQNYHDADEYRAGEERAHMAECQDPSCRWTCCRLARGWTAEQIRAYWAGQADQQTEDRPCVF
jgi:hypothetical protein